MKAYLFFILLLILVQSSYSQITIKGKIYAADKEALHYATVYLKHKNTGTYTDATGSFYLTVESINPDDTLVVSHVGHQQQELAVTALNAMNNLQLILRQDTSHLQEITLQYQEDNKEWKGNTGKHYTDMYYEIVRNSSETAYLITDVKHSRLSRTGFYIGKHKGDILPFRIHVYLPDKHNNQPGKELLRQSIIVEEYKKKDWVFVDLDTLHLYIPKDSIYVSIEWLPDPDFQHNAATVMEWKHGQRMKEVPHGCLGFSKNQLKSDYWIRENFGKWTQVSNLKKYGKMKLENTDLPGIIPMIKAEFLLQ